MTGQTLEEQLAELRQKDEKTLEYRKEHLQAVYRNAVEQIGTVAKEMNIDQEDLVTLCVQTVQTRRDTTWIDVLDILDELYMNKRRMDRESRGGEIAWQRK